MVMVVVVVTPAVPTITARIKITFWGVVTLNVVCPNEVTCASLICAILIPPPVIFSHYLAKLQASDRSYSRSLIDQSMVNGAQQFNILDHASNFAQNGRTY